MVPERLFALAEIQLLYFCSISVLFQFYFNCAGSFKGDTLLDRFSSTSLPAKRAPKRRT